MPLSVDHLKVDQTALPEHNGRFIFLTNVNVPARYLDHADTRQTFERLGDFIRTEYARAENIQYQLTSAYELRHSTTGQIRLFHGTFHPAGNATAALTEFRPLGADFVDHALEHLTLRKIFAKLDFPDLDTSWVIHRVRSVIVNIQAIAERDHEAILRRNLQSSRSSRRSRTHVSYYLP